MICLTSSRVFLTWVDVVKGFFLTEPPEIEGLCVKLL